MRKLVLVIGSLSLLAACHPVDRPAADFGDAVRQNMAAQIIPPSPTAASMPEEHDGQRTDSALQRYHDNKVYRPVGSSTVRIDQPTSPGVSQ